MKLIAMASLFISLHLTAQVSPVDDSLCSCFEKIDARCPFYPALKDTLFISKEDFEKCSGRNMGTSYNSSYSGCTFFFNLDGKKYRGAECLKYKLELMVNLAYHHELVFYIYNANKNVPYIICRHNGEHFIGYYREFNANGKLKEEGEYGEDYKKTGEWKSYNDKGELQKTKNYKHN